MAKWISVKDKMPEIETEVLIRAQWKCDDMINSIITTAFYEDGTVLEDDSRWHWEEIWEWGEYDKEKDGYRIPKGWRENCQYGNISNNDIYDEVTHWMPFTELVGKRRGGRAMNNKQASSGIGFTGLLTIVFIVLKLCGIITWSWWWVLSPLWISAILCAVLVIIVLLVEGRN